MKILLSVGSSNEDFDGIDYAFVEIDQAYAIVLLSRLRQFKECHETDPQLSRMEYRDYAPTWIDDGVYEKLAYEWFWGPEFTVEDGNPAKLADDVELPEPEGEGAVMWTELDRLVVSEDGFHWSCYLKYDNGKVTSDMVPVDWVEEIACLIPSSAPT